MSTSFESIASPEYEPQLSDDAVVSMPSPSGESPVGHFKPAHKRHSGFRFFDGISKLWHRVDDLAPHPEDPSKQVANLTVEDEFGPLAEYERIIVEPGEIQEGRDYKKIIVGAGAAVLVVTVATGTLIIHHKNKN